MSEEMLTPEDQMTQWITSKWITKPICVVVELGRADLLRHGPLGVDTLAEKTETRTYPSSASQSSFISLHFSGKRGICVRIDGTFPVSFVRCHGT